MKETKFKQTLVQTKEGSRHCEERSDVAIQSGFKMTEVGMIPNNWEIKPLKDIAGLKAGKMTSYNDFNPKYPCFGGNGIRAYLSHYSHDGIYPIIGRQGELCGNVNLAKGKFYATEHAVVASPKKDIDAIWLYYQLTALNLNQYATGCAQPGLSVEKINDVYTQVPPTIKEQQRIANALSDVDSLINNLEKLIAKKKNIKQGAMQQLLTGKKRLPGFAPAKPTYKQTELGKIPTDWEFEVFGKLVSIYRGGSPRPIEAYITTNPSGINWIKIGDVEEGAKYITSTQERIIPEGKSKSREVHKGDFILSNSMSFGRPYILKVDGCIHDGWLTIQDYQDTFDTDFLYYMLSSEVVFNQYVSMAAGSSVQNLNKEKVAAVKLFYPPSKTEQSAIANVFSDMDTEIATLETKLAKYRKLKTGMMQQLLTGKIRLV